MTEKEPEFLSPKPKIKKDPLVKLHSAADFSTYADPQYSNTIAAAVLCIFYI